MSSLVEARREVVSSATSSYGANRVYGVKLFEFFGMVLFAKKGTPEARSPEAKLLKAEKTALYDELKAADHKNPYKIWGDVMKYAKEAAGIVEPVRSGERAPKVRNVEELLALYKYNLGLDTDEMDDVNILIGKALALLGVDLAEVNK